MRFSGPDWVGDEENEPGKIPPPSNGSSSPQPGPSHRDDNAATNGHDHEKPKTEVQAANEVTIGQLSEDTGGMVCSVSDAIANLMYRDRRAKKPFPWKVSLEIGPQVRINTVGYIQVRAAPGFTFCARLLNLCRNAQRLIYLR